MNFTALHWCAINGHNDISRYLIKHNADVNAVEKVSVVSHVLIIH